ncbi:hypothetical protein [Janthinobacterium sp. 17J80-10]|uniref:hypothetical protein n=1 Tax=Janthinobacterium sp. 17J80-10 TaxID=2497863 RepID=UPI00100556AA|nr:hypothetical protein [Janthinobacterium sp. 17J80-10]QAU35161.1 hypothetical protein EKL02_13790 [Janthinobacterium sp. 17J80-10]
MKSKMGIEQDDEQYRDVRVDFAPANDFTKEVYTVRLSLDKEFGMISESDWTYVTGEGAAVTELDNEPPAEVLAAYAALKEQAEALVEQES